MGDDAKRTVLARRATFIAAALATAVATTDCKPRPCLSVKKPVEDDETTQPRACLSQPVVCLSPPPMVRDGGTDASDPPIGPPSPPKG